MKLAVTESSGEGEAADARPSVESVRAEVEKIVASPDFGTSERARKFLRYVVEESLCGRSDRIKAYTVALEVFGRDESFDAQHDPVVRIEAGRLRRALERYYLLAGREDPVVVEIPKGGYVPAFRMRDEVGQARANDAAVEAGLPSSVPPAVAGRAAARDSGSWLRLSATMLVPLAAVSAIAWYAWGLLPFDGESNNAGPSRPSVLVLPFADLGGDSFSKLYSAAITDEIVTALARYKEITVFGAQTSRSVGLDADLGKLRSELNVGYVLEGSVRADSGNVRVTARLLDAGKGAVLSSRNYEHSLTASNLFGIPAVTAGDVAQAVAQPYGIVFKAEAARAAAQPPDDLGAYLCSLRYYSYHADLTVEGHDAVRDCLKRSVARFPTYATAWALLAHVYIDEARFGFNPRPGQPSPEELALSSARRAVRLDPENARALQALAVALFFSNRVPEAYEAAEKALAANPNDTELLGQLGHVYGLSGRTEEGRALLERALALNPSHTGYYRGVLATIAYMQRDYDTALAEIERVNMQKLPIYYAVAAIIYAQKGLSEQAGTAIEHFQQMAPDFIPNIWTELDRRNIPLESQLHMVDGLRKAGAVIPPNPNVGASAGTAG